MKPHGFPNLIHSKPTIPVGFVAKTHGVEGCIKVNWDNPESIEIPVEGGFLLLVLEGAWVPFLIEQVQAQSIYKLAWVQNVEHAQNLLGAEVHLFGDALPKESISTNALLEGFELHDQEGTYVGKIMSLEDYPGHQILEVMFQEQCILVPYHPDLIVHKDNSKRILQLIIPDQLLDL